MKPPDHARGAAPKDRAQRKTLARGFGIDSSVKASGRNDIEAAQANPGRIAQWLTHALCLTELAASNPRALEMLRVHLEAMREELA